jgi:two-component system, chemotaxis family, sensor kinase CheA
VSRQSEDRNNELRALFFESAAELLQALNEAGLELEARPSDEEVIRRVRRVIHTLKGDSAACGLHKLSELAHELEDVLTPQVAGAHGADLPEVVLAAADSFDAMLAAYQKNAKLPSVDGLHKMIRRLLETPEKATKTGSEAPQAPEQFTWTEYEQLMISEAVHRGDCVYNIALRIDPNSLMRAAAFQLIRNVLHGSGTVIALRPEDNVAAANVEVVEAALASTQSEEKLFHRCRIPSIVSEVRIERVAASQMPEHELLGDLLEEQAAKVVASGPEGIEGDRTPKAQAPGSAAVAVAESTLRVDAARIDAVMNLVGELIIGKSMLHRTLTEFDKQHARDPVRTKLADAMAFQARILDELHKCVLKIRMVPVEQLFRRFPRIVRDVAKQCGKDVALEISGQNTDLDKGILDALAEPLMHLVRNAVDHGVGSAEERLAAGKPARGTVYLNAYHQGTQVVIEVRDDGRGIDLALVRAQATKKGIIKAEEAQRLSDQDALNLIFESGFSTAAEVTEVSGRGIGMDVVRSNIDQIGGTIDVKSVLGRGTSFTIKIPLTLAIVSALIVEAGGNRFAIPQLAVVELVRVRNNSEHRIERIKDAAVLRLRNKLLPLVRLSTLLGLDRGEAGVTTNGFIVVTQVGSQLFGIVVDGVFHTEEIVVKPMSSKLRHIPVFSGNTILGDGSVIMIIDPNGVAHTIGSTASGRHLADEERDADADSAQANVESLLVFRAGSPQPKAVPLSLVTRLEEIDARSIEMATGRPLVQYRGQLMPLVPANENVRIKEGGSQPLLVFTDEGRSMGLLVDEIVDIVEEKLEIEVASQREGVLGSAVIKGQATEVIDIAHFLPLAFEDWMGWKGHRVERAQRRILLIDDAPFFRNMLTPVLKAAGYAVSSAASAQEALALLQDGRQFDVVITDIEMPGMDGFELASAMRSNPSTAGLPIIGLSSLVSAEAIERGRQVGLHDYVAKFDRQGLIAALKEQTADMGRAA